MNRRVKDDLMHGFRHELRRRLPLGLDASGHIDVAQDNAAKNRSLGIGVFRQHRDSNCGESFCHDFSQRSPNTFRGLTTPSAPTLVAFGIIFLMARPPLLCKEGNTFLFKICPTPSPYFFAISAGMGYIAVRGRSLWIGRDRR